MASLLNALVPDENMGRSTPLAPNPTSAIQDKFLGDLGKPTMRGVRRCDKCGTLNGTRGTKCKNKACNQMFKSAERKKPFGPEAIKLVTDPALQVYSVRTKTGDVRGFVQLPLVQDLDGNPAVVDVGIVCSAAKCYVDTCGRSKNDALEPCFHIKSSVEAIDEATPMPVNESILDTISLPPNIKEQIYEAAIERLGPLVQRVTKNIMAVKTTPTVKSPTGYVHFTFFNNKKDEKRFVCSCKESKMVKVIMPDNGSECIYKIQRCVHFYTCLCAFASDVELSKEFKFALDAEYEEKTMQVLEDGAEDEISIVTENDVAAGAVCNDLFIKDTPPDGDQTMEIEIASTNNLPLDYTSCSFNTPVTIHDFKRFKADAAFPSFGEKVPNLGQVNESFMQWLSAVTEQINLTMHFQLPGNPKPLVHYIPQMFWECLQLRISLLSVSKRRLPDSSATVVRTESPPIGIFTKYTWNLTELSLIRKIFDTPQVSLQITKYFDKSKDGSYKLSVTPRVQVEAVSESYEQKLPTKTHEYKTLLRAGCQGNKKPVPFVIEWIPDIFPVTRTGELTITFQYSHLMDGLAPAVHNDLVKQVIDTTSRHILIDDS